MKKVFLFAAMLAMAASCSVSEFDSNKETNAPEIIASHENKGSKTAITTDSDGVGTIWWKPADEINIFYGTASTHYTSENKENATTVTFGTTDIIGSTESTSKNIWGLYPYDEDAVCDGASVTTSIPAIQKAVAGTFDDDLFTSLAHSTSTVMTFYNVLGGIKFCLSRDDIRAITFKGNNNEDLAGKVKLKMDANDRPVAEITEGEETITLTPKEGTTFTSDTNYYMVMLPVVLSKGFTMTFETETKIGTFEYTEKSVDIKRSVFSKKENIDSYASFEDKDYDTTPFTISSIGSTSVALAKVGSPHDITLEYRMGKESWSAYTIGTSINLADGEFVQFRAGEGGNEEFSSKDYFYGSKHRFVVLGSGTVKVFGNIMFLLDKTGERTTMPDYGFMYLFRDCNRLTDASKLKLPATNLAEGCYEGMFSDCTSLQTAPELPATNLANFCYKRMFSGCTSLQTTPELSATNLAYRCYSQMFSRCTNLQTAPELPATTLAQYCYEKMFLGCTSLQTAPKLSATTLAQYCYEYMFSGCTNLQTAPELPAISLTQGCYQGMFERCTSLKTAPELPATNLDLYCYCGMFSGCSKLNYVKAMFETTLLCYTESWLAGVSPTGTFVKSKNATWNVTGPNGIPEGWTVQIAE